MRREYRICSRCIMDTSDPQISFDAAGNCTHCTAAIERIRRQLLPIEQRRQALERLADQIKKEGKGKVYDCIIGVSGGLDSSTTALHVKKLGLRPLAVHFDNGWNSELAVDNIKKLLDALKLDLYTFVVDWEEFRDLQMSFLKASVPNCEIPTDHGIVALLFHMAYKHRTRFILMGSNIATESILPIAWAYYHSDLKHMLAIHGLFSKTPLRSMPTISLFEYMYFVFIHKIRQIPFLNYLNYNKEEAKKHLVQEIGWRDCGGKHYESIWTRFFQGFYLPVKFGFDKRRAHFSSLICSGGMTREQALAEMERPAYPKDLLQTDIQFVIKKFGITQEEFAAILNTPPKTDTDYPSHELILIRMPRVKNLFRKIATTP